MSLKRVEQDSDFKAVIFNQTLRIQSTFRNYIVLSGKCEARAHANRFLAHTIESFIHIDDLYHILKVFNCF